MSIKTGGSFFTFFFSVLIGVLLWAISLHTLSAQNPIPLTVNALPSQQILPNRTALYTHLLINNGDEEMTLTFTAESVNGWHIDVSPSAITIGVNETAKLNIWHMSPDTTGNGDEDVATVTVQGDMFETKIVNTTIVDAPHGFIVMSSPDTIYAQSAETVYYDLQIMHIGTLVDEISARVVGVTPPLTATVQSGISRILPPDGTINLRIAVDIPDGTIDGTAATITVSVTSDHLSEGRYSHQLTVRTLVGNHPLTPTPTRTPWAFPTAETTPTPTPTPTPIPPSIVVQNTSVWDQPYPSSWESPSTELTAGDIVMILYETFEWIEISWDEGEGWVPSAVLTGTAEAIEFESQPVPLTVMHSGGGAGKQGMVWGVIGAAVCALILTSIAVQRALDRIVA